MNDKRDAAVDPRFSIEVHFMCRIPPVPPATEATFRDAGTHTLTARDVLNSNPIMLNATPAGLGDIIQSGGVMQIDGACTALADAYDTAFDAASGGRSAKRRAGEAAALTKAQEIGLVAVGLAST